MPAAIADYMILDVIAESGGWAEAVSDAEIIAAAARVAREEGISMCPEGAATYAVYEAARARGDIRPDERVVLFNCATGLKYPLPCDAPVLKADQPLDWSALSART